MKELVKKYRDAFSLDAIITSDLLKKDFSI
jgi:hypothetical protein